MTTIDSACIEQRWPSRCTVCRADQSMSDEIAELYLSSRRKYVSFAPLIHSDSEIRVWMRDRLIPTADVFVAMENDVILGMMALSSDDRYFWLDHLYIHPENTGGGIGSLLLQLAKERLQEFRLYTFQENVVARRFYEKHGLRAIEFSDGRENEERCPDVLYEWRAEERHL